MTAKQNDKKNGEPRSLDGLVRCPICGEPREKFSKGRTMVKGELIGVEACDWCGTHFLTLTLDEGIEPSPNDNPDLRREGR